MKTAIMIGLGVVLLAIALLKPSTTGFASVDPVGCCATVCQQTPSLGCPDGFYAGRDCKEVAACEVGCCIDREGYCLGNYLRSNCAKAEGEFILISECKETLVCLQEKDAASLQGPTGYVAKYRSSDKGAGFTWPSAGKRGDSVLIGMQDFGTAQQVEAELSIGAYQERFALYDDGSHGDGEPQDQLWAAVWQSARAPALSGISPVQISFRVDGEPGSSAVFFLSSTDCVPYRMPWSDPGARKDIVLVDAINTPHFAASADSLVRQLETRYGTGLDQANVYALKLPATTSDRAEIRSAVLSACPFFDSAQDSVVAFSAIDACEQDGELVVVNPLFGFREAIAQESLSDLLARFCDTAVTQSMVEQEIQDSLEDIPVRILAPLPGLFTSQQLLFSFIVDEDSDASLSYTIYLDTYDPAMVLAQGSASANSQIDSALTVIDGTHDLILEVEDSEGRKGYASVEVNMDEANFIADAQFEATSATLTFTHLSDFSVTYQILGDGELMSSGSANVEAPEYVALNLAQGTHTLQVVAEDSAGRKALTIPEEVEVP
ncbi:MAG: hypothetical protein Q7S65_06385 [Nanoarchaeota archaeon]|nr:hypothetical protein [Nanoarchaeota archaeon]